MAKFARNRSQTVAELTSIVSEACLLLMKYPGRFRAKYFQIKNVRLFRISSDATKEHVRMAKFAFGQSMPKRKHYCCSYAIYHGLFCFWLQQFSSSYW